MKMTLADIAQRAGVSKATASRVINGRTDGASPETRRRILDLVEETGYRLSAVARGLATGKSQSVGLIIPDITNPFHPQLVRGAEDVLARAGYSLFLCNSDADLAKEKQYVQVLLEKGVDGVIINSAASDCDCQLELLEAAGVPYVVLDRIIEGHPDSYGVFLDNREGARLAAWHLLSSPDCRLLYLNGPAGHSQSRLRRAGVEDALSQLSLSPNCLLVAPGDYSLESGGRLVAEILDEAGFTAGGATLPFNAIFACNDLMAIGAMREFKRRRIAVPEQVRVVGFDDIELASLVEPPLSTVSQPTFEMGTRSAELLLRLIAGHKPRQRILTLKPSLVLRGSG
jgi:LacI family transcriptional regulator